VHDPIFWLEGISSIPGLHFNMV